LESLLSGRTDLLEPAGEAQPRVFRDVERTWDVRVWGKWLPWSRPRGPQKDEAVEVRVAGLVVAVKLERIGVSERVSAGCERQRAKSEGKGQGKRKAMGCECVVVMACELELGRG